MSSSSKRPVDLQLRHLSKSYGSTVAVSDFSLTIEEGEFIAFLGPSGCGKTTTLRMIAGFVTPTSGTIVLKEKDITRVPPNRRNIGMVFQSYALFPHMSVAKNVEFGLRCHQTPKEDVRRRTDEALEIVDLEHLRNRYPRELSGGQQQRVALARVLALNPSLLLFDEPLSNLDAKLRLQMRSEIRRLQRDIGITALFVTHDQEEAMSMADRIVILNAGRIEQIGTPRDIYDRPESKFVADFVGTSNLLEGDIVLREDSTWFVTRHGLEIALPGGLSAASAASVAVRPEKIDLFDATANVGTRGKVHEANHLGPMMEYVVGLEGGDVIKVSDLRRGGRRTWSQGEELRASWRTDDVIVIPH